MVQSQWLANSPPRQPPAPTTGLRSHWPLDAGSPSASPSIRWCRHVWCRFRTGHDRVSGRGEGLDRGRHHRHAVRDGQPCAIGSAGSRARPAWRRDILLLRPQGRSDQGALARWRGNVARSEAAGGAAFIWPVSQSGAGVPVSAARPGYLLEGEEGSADSPGDCSPRRKTGAIRVGPRRPAPAGQMPALTVFYRHILSHCDRCSPCRRAPRRSLFCAPPLARGGGPGVRRRARIDADPRPWSRPLRT